MSIALSVDLRRRVLAAVREEGLTHRQAAERFRVSAASVSRWRAWSGRRAIRAPALWAATAGPM